MRCNSNDSSNYKNEWNCIVIAIEEWQPVKIDIHSWIILLIYKTFKYNIRIVLLYNETFILLPNNIGKYNSILIKLKN